MQLKKGRILLCKPLRINVQGTAMSEARKALLGALALGSGKLTPRPDPELGIAYFIEDKVAGVQKVDEAAMKDLVSRGALIPEAYDRVVACPRCGSLRVIVKERCPYCNSQMIKVKKVLRHIKHGHSTVIDAAIEGAVKCLACGERLSEGDFKVTGLWFKCDKCHESFNKPEASYICLMDGMEFTYYDAKLVDIPTYVLSPVMKEGLRKEIEIVTPIVELLRARGYDVKAPGKAIGASNMEHEFDIIASSDVETIGIDVIMSTNPDLYKHVMPIMIKAVDTKLTNVMLIVTSPLSPDVKPFLSTARINVIEGAAPVEIMNAVSKAFPPNS